MYLGRLGLFTKLPFIKQLLNVRMISWTPIVNTETKGNHAAHCVSIKLYPSLISISAINAAITCSRWLKWINCVVYNKTQHSCLDACPVMAFVWAHKTSIIPLLYILFFCKCMYEARKVSGHEFVCYGYLLSLFLCFFLLAFRNINNGRLFHSNASTVNIVLFSPHYIHII